jgi:UDP-3-O-acyl-N-acetylglucosamine deacetylase
MFNTENSAMSDLVGDSKSFQFKDECNTVLDKALVRGYCSDDTTIFLYLDGWQQAEELSYDDESVFNADLKLLSSQFE